LAAVVGLVVVALTLELLVRRLRVVGEVTVNMNPLELLTGMQPNLAAAAPPPNNPMAAFQLGARPESEEVIGARRELDGLREQDDFVSTWLKGELASKKEPSRKSLAADALANFARGALMGPRFKSAQDEQAERDAIENQRKSAMIQAAISNNRAKQSAALAMITDARLREKDEEINTYRMAEHQRKVAADADLQRSRVVREALSQKWFELTQQKNKNQNYWQEKKFLQEKMEAELGNPWAVAKYLAGGDNATPDQVKAKYLELEKDKAEIKAKYKPAGGSGGAIDRISPMWELSPRQAQFVSQIQGQLQANPTVQNFGKVKSAFDTIRSGMEADTGPGDIALLREYAILLDPATGVREEEYRSMAGATGLKNSINLWLSGKWTEGHQLSPDARKQFYNIAKTIYNNRAKDYQKTIAPFKGRALAVGIPEPAKYLTLDEPEIVDEPATPVNKPLIPGMSGGGKTRIDLSKFER
jgi:hypothetical protein